MLTKLFHCSAVYSDARIKATEQWDGRDGESSEIGTRQDERVISLTNDSQLHLDHLERERGESFLSLLGAPLIKKEIIYSSRLL